MLRGTIRDHTTRERRAFIRFFACQQDLSHESPDTPLPDEVASGKEPFLVIGAIAGGEADMTRAGPVDELVAKTPEWRGAMLARLRKIVHAADPPITEDLKGKRP